MKFAYTFVKKWGLKMNQSSKVYDNFVVKLNEKMMEVKRKKFSHLIFLCIGTDRVTGDSFGPLVGHKLKEQLGQKYKNILVIGNLKEPLCSTNYLEKLKLVHQMASNPYIIAIDSAFSRQEEIRKNCAKRRRDSIR